MPTPTANQIVDSIRKVLANHQGDWMAIEYVYEQLISHPLHYGLQDYTQVPLLPAFENICKVSFRTKKEEGRLYMREYMGRRKKDVS